MTPPADPRAARWPRLLLLAALLLGIAAMHTLGHPTQAHAQAPAPAHAPTAATPASASGPVVGREDAAPADSVARPAAAAQAHTHTGETGRADSHGSHDAGTGTGTGMAMDPMSLCLAVLAAALGAVFALGAGRRTGAGSRDAGARPPGGLRRGRPEPPPPRETLVKLVALRV